MRVFIGLTEIAGYYTNLAQGLEQVGVQVTFVNLGSNPFKYGNDETQSLLVKAAKHSALKRAKTSRQNLVKKLFWIGTNILTRLLLLGWAINKFDVFIFGFGTSFLGGREFALLKLFKKKIICNIAHGSEARPPYINGAFLSPDGKALSAEQLIHRTNLIKQKLNTIEKYADIIIGYPLTAHFLTRPFINWLFLGVPYEASSLPASQPDLDQARTIRALHSPSRPVAKGTPCVRQAIQSLQEQGYDVELVEIIGQPNATVLKELAQCDFVIDQLYSDTPMAGFATEAAWFGKPAVVGGYGWAELKKIIPPEQFPPSQICHPNQFEAAIEQLIVDEAYRLDLGKRAHEFVGTHWSALQVARNYIRLLNDDIPVEWWYDPTQIDYVNGMGVSVDKAKKMIRSLLVAGGSKSLRLDNKPQLLQKFIEFAGGMSETKQSK